MVEIGEVIYVAEISYSHDGFDWYRTKVEEIRDSDFGFVMNRRRRRIARKKSYTYTNGVRTEGLVFANVKEITNGLILFEEPIKRLLFNPEGKLPKTFEDLT